MKIPAKNRDFEAWHYQQSNPNISIYPSDSLLVAHQGDLSKTFKELGSQSSVKSLVTSMAISGALSGFDGLMGWEKAADG
ncbi:DUF637 domain-containing protein, partial [Yersinia sp. Marseille-Q3913]|nr:DUF637 domain-containing protein [Yersinia sp. Marseille-Q3913]